jgi:hypothetical protein
MDGDEEGSRKISVRAVHGSAARDTFLPDFSSAALNGRLDDSALSLCGCG